MSYASSLDAKEQVRQAVDIVDLVGDYLQLRREGRGYKALCPWHNDSRPSLQVNPDRQTFRCFVCDIGGDIFAFKMKMEGITFPEALNMLAERAGITLDTRGGSPDAAEAKRQLYQAMAWAEQQYHDCLLHAPEAQGARDYLSDRHITAETIAQAKLGYAPEAWEWILEQARGTRYSPKVLEAIGLAAPRSSGAGYYDRFRGRVLFSIHDPQGRPVALGGRVLPGTPEAERSGAKYINSPETPLFSKSSLLYGLDVAKDALSKSRTAIVMEGYTDCLIARQFGFANAVAVLGTALGERHIKLLRRFVDTIVLVLDGDEAGRRRTEQVLELFVAEQMDLRILTLPDELDPAEFLLERGAPALQQLLDTAVDALEHRYTLAMSGVSADSGLHTVLQAVESVLATLAKSPRLQGQVSSAIQLREDQILHRLAQRSGLEDTRLRQRLAELRRTARRPTAQPRTDGPQSHPGETQAPRSDEQASATPAPIAAKQAYAERWLLQIILEQPALLAAALPTVGVENFRCPRRRALYAACCRLADAGRVPSFERLMLEFDEPELKSLLVELDEERQAMKRTDTAKELRELLETFSEASMSPTPGPPPNGQAPEDDMQQLQQLLQQKRSRQGISVPTDG